MMIHVWGGGPAPDLYAAYTVVKQLELSWEAVLGYKPSLEEIGLLVECFNIAQVHNEMKRDAATRA